MKNPDPLLRFGEPGFPAPADLQARPLVDQVAHILYHAHAGREVGKDYYSTGEQIARADAAKVVALLERHQRELGVDVPSD